MNHFWVYWNVPEQTENRTSLDYRGISIASFRRRRPTRIPTVLMHLIGEQSRSEERRSAQFIFIGLEITDDIFRTWRPEIFPSRFSFVVNFRGRRKRERKTCAKVYPRYPFGKDECAGCASSASIMKFILRFPARHSGRHSGISFSALRCRGKFSQITRSNLKPVANGRGWVLVS